MATKKQRRKNKVKISEKKIRRSIEFPNGHKLEYNLETVTREIETHGGRENFRKKLKRCLTKEKFIEVLGEIGLHWAVLEVLKGPKP